MMADGRFPIADLRTKTNKFYRGVVIPSAFGIGYFHVLAKPFPAAQRACA